MLLDVRADHLNLVQEILRKFVPDREVWAFGSRAKWLAKEYSDLDLCIVGETPLGFRVLGLLEEAFDESDLPYKVDIVDWATTSESFRKIIEQDKVVVQEGGKGLGMQQIQLGKVCLKIGSGATPRGGKDAYRGGNTTLIRSQNIYNDRFTREGLAYINDSQANELRNVVVEKNDVLLNITGDSVARCCQADPDVLPARVNQHVAIIRTQPDMLDARFLRYVLISPSMQNHLLALASAGATRNALTKGMIESLYIQAPPIEEQRAIAHILGTLDDKIELNRKQNETLEAMARALFKAWFVDFEPVRAKLEGRWQRGQSLPGLPAHLYDLFPDRLVDSELGEIPEGWEYKQLSKFIEILDSRRVPLSSKERAERRGVYPYHGATGVMDSVDGYLFDGIHVLLGEDGSVIRENGHPFTQYVWGMFWVNNHAHVLRGQGISNETLLLFLDQCDVAPFVTGAVQLKLNQGNLKSIPFLNPGEILLGKLGELIAPIFGQIRDVSDESRSLTQLRDTLLPKLLSGELRVPDVEALLEQAESSLRNPESQWRHSS